jgi:hypothetical protein
VNGLHVVRVIQAAQRSLRAGGREVPVDDALTGVVVMPRRDDNAPDDVPTAPSPASALKV